MFMFRKKKREEQPKKDVSVTLKRQVPIRTDETPRSWLGGQPMMPEQQDWPRDKAGAPLQFLAQVCCIDLPEGLWNGAGPREGWLLLFVETLKLEMEGEAKTGSVSMLHIDALGPEREPPEDMPIVRHSMSDYIDTYQPDLHACVPKLWRKWPVDLVAQTYVVDEDVINLGAPVIAAEQLYDGPVAQRGIKAFIEETDIDRPLTWRGALYFIERLLRDHSPEKSGEQLNHNFNPAEVNKSYLADEIKTRFEAHPGSKDQEPGSYQRSQKIKADIKEALAAEWRHGWLTTYFSAQEKEVLQFEAEIAENTAKLRAEGGNPKVSYRPFYENQIRGRKLALKISRETRAHIDAVCQGRSIEEAETKLWEDIDAAEAAFAEWRGAIKDKLEECKRQILEQNMQELLSDKDWEDLRSRFSSKVLIWSTRHYGGAVMRFERELYVQTALEMALREDILDLYARGELALPDEQMTALEANLRASGEVPHRMGGRPNSVQGNVGPDNALLFQLTSDGAMGWMWHDAGAVYVETSPEALAQGDLSGVTAMIEGG